MLVQNKHLTTIWYVQNTDKIKIIDQRLIPFELKIIELNTVDDVCFAIKEMQVRGAPLIGCLLYTSPSPRDRLLSRMPSSA